MIRGRVRVACVAVVILGALSWLAGGRVIVADQIHLAPAQKPISLQGGAGGYVPYHYGPTLICSDCHIMHASQAHDYDGSTASAFSGESGAMLLKAPDSLQLCLSCHDGKPGVPDVIGPDANSLTERSAGFFQPPNLPNTKGHNLGSGLSSDAESICARCHTSGDISTAAVTCVDCHSPHGNGNPRNLKWASWPGAEPLFGLLVNPAASGMQRYERANVAYGTLNSDALREVSNMCLDCHHIFSGSHYTNPNGGIHRRHPSYDSERSSPNSIGQGAARGTTKPDHWVGGTGSGFIGAARVPFLAIGSSSFSSAVLVSADTNGVFCLSCHKAHGGDHQFGLTWSTEGGSGARGCDQCHAISVG